jgi:hypothetical protein
MTVSDLNKVITHGMYIPEGERSELGFRYNAKEPIVGTEDDVILAFNSILDRNPDYGELRYYSQKVNNNINFDIEKLKQLLIASDEYKRLEKTQSNLAYSDALGGITDRQLTYVIASIYEEEASQPIDDSTLAFLKKRYNELQLNDEKLRVFIRQYIVFQRKFERDITNAAATGVSRFSRDPLGISLSKTKEDREREERKRERDEWEREHSKGKKHGYEDGHDDDDDDKRLGVKKPNKDLIKKLEQLYDTDNSEYLDSSRVIKSLLEDDDNETCSGNVDKNALEKRLEAMDKQLLAKLVYDRNMDHMKNVCRRNNKYLNADQDMVLFPEFKWSVPQAFPPVCTPLEKNEYNPMIDQSSLIGTLLSDASKTKVGSILPKTPPH